MRWWKDGPVFKRLREQPGLVKPWIQYQGQKALDDNTSPGISDCACLVEHEEVFG
jgi:hypothetical protein